MNKKALLWLGLLTSCDALWQSQLSTDPTLCTQASSPCPTGQLCDFSAGVCQPIGGTNPPGWAVTTPTVNSCPQPPTITVTGPGSATAPQVRLNTTDVDPADVKVAADGTLTIQVPRQLAAGPVQVTLTFSATQPPVLLTSPGVKYVTQTPAVTALSLLPLTLSQLPPTVSQVAAWRPKKGTLDLAVLGGANNTVARYRNALVATRQPASFPSTLTLSALAGGGTLQTANLAIADDTLSPGDQDLLTATSDPGSAAFFLGLSDVPQVGKVPTLSPTYPVLRQLVAGGYFRDGEGPVQALTFLGWQSPTATLPIKRSPSPSLKLPSADFLNLQTTIVAPQPLAVATGLLNNDANTDILLLVGAMTGTTSVGYWINGGASPVGTPFSTLPGSATTVAIGDLNGDLMPDAVFGLNSGATQNGQVMVYLNQSTKGSPAIAWDQANPLLSQAKLAPAALAVADYNGDGKNDILYAAADGVHVLINQLGQPGMPPFADVLVYSAPTAGGGWAATSLVAVDFSGDSRPDVVVAEGRSHTVLFLENSCLPAPQG